jgi:hypothetical protein
VAGAVPGPLSRVPAKPRDTGGWRAVGRRGTVVAVTDDTVRDRTDETDQPDQPDLEYDLAHEADVRQVAPDSVVEAVYVPTQTAGYDGDYGYDLAHEVPGR